MARLDSFLNIDAAKLRKWGYLKQETGGKSGRILWNDGESVVQCATMLFGDGNWMQLRYTVSTYEEKKAMDYSVPLIPTPCRLGSLRWWFLCPHCRRRCRILYYASPLFVCRTCTGAWYRSQEYRGGFCGLLRRLLDADDFEATMERWYYRGRPTRKHRKLLRLRCGLSREDLMRATYGAMLLSP